jgi:hypothetical protein
MVFSKEVPMKRLPFYFFVLPAVILIAAAAVAIEIDYQKLTERGGVEALISYDPLGPNNQIAAYLKFINNNDYAVDVTWMPIISCGDGPPKEGISGVSHLDGRASYEVTLWRTGVCGLVKISDFKVKMEVKESSR